MTYAGDPYGGAFTSDDSDSDGSLFVATLPAFDAELTGTSVPPPPTVGVVDATLPAFIASASGTVVNPIPGATGTLEASLPGFTATATGRSGTYAGGPDAIGVAFGYMAYQQVTFPTAGTISAVRVARMTGNTGTDPLVGYSATKPTGDYNSIAWLGKTQAFQYSSTGYGQPLALDTPVSVSAGQSLWVVYAWQYFGATPPYIRAVLAPSTPSGGVTLGPAYVGAGTPSETYADYSLNIQGLLAPLPANRLEGTLPSFTGSLDGTLQWGELDATLPAFTLTADGTFARIPLVLEGAAGDSEIVLTWNADPGASATALLDFESGQLPTGATFSTAPTFPLDADPVNGTSKTMQVHSTGNNTDQHVSFPISLSQDGTVRIRYHLESEGNYDFYRLSVDGTQVFAASGNMAGWTYHDVAMTAGEHLLKFQFTSDGSVIRGYNSVRIGSISYPSTPVYEYRVDGGTPVQVAGTTATVEADDSPHVYEVRIVTVDASAPWSNALSIAAITPDLIATLPAFTGTMSGRSLPPPEPIDGTLAGTLPAFTAAFTSRTSTFQQGKAQEVVVDGGEGATVGFAAGLGRLMLEVVDNSIEQAPTALVVTVNEAMNNGLMTFYIDGHAVYTARADTQGTLWLHSIPVEENRGSKGEHTITVVQAGVDSDSATFTVERHPNLYPTVRGLDLSPVPVAEATRSNGVQAWVLQDLMPDGLGSYIFPINPAEWDNPAFERNLGTDRTTALTGKFHVYEAGQSPLEFSFSGYCPNQAMHDKLKAYGNLKRRFYLHDHRKRVWEAVFTQVDLKPRLHQNDIYGDLSDWVHDYTINAIIYNQEDPVQL